MLHVVAYMDDTIYVAYMQHDACMYPPPHNAYMQHVSSSSQSLHAT